MEERRADLTHTSICTTHFSSHLVGRDINGLGMQAQAFSGWDGSALCQLRTARFTVEAHM